MAPPKADRKKILIIDDEVSIVKYLEALLQDHDYETIAASNGNEGMEKVRSETPDLICLDITMPEKSGIRFYRELKEDGDPAIASTPVVVVTAVTGYGYKPEDFQKFISGRKHIPPPDGFIPKPIDRDELLKGVTSLLS